MRVYVQHQRSQYRDCVCSWNSPAVRCQTNKCSLVYAILYNFGTIFVDSFRSTDGKAEIAERCKTRTFRGTILERVGTEPRACPRLQEQHHSSRLVLGIIIDAAKFAITTG